MTYRNIFDNTPLHVTRFCVELDRIEGDVTNAESGVLVVGYRAHDKHNC
jgi:hypothetical protein